MRKLLLTGWSLLAAGFLSLGTSGAARHLWPPRQPHEPCRDRNRLRRVEPETERVFAETLTGQALYAPSHTQP